MKLNLFMCFSFLFLFFETILKFSILFPYSYSHILILILTLTPFYSHILTPFYSHLLTLCFRYLQTCIKESCKYLSCQVFSNLPIIHWNSQENPRMHFLVIYRPKFQIFPSVSTLGPSQGATELSKQ